MATCQSFFQDQPPFPMSAPSERVLAPLAVLGLHLLLLSNVALHRPDLLTPTKRTVLEWLLALGAILAYVTWFEGFFVETLWT